MIHEACGGGDGRRGDLLRLRGHRRHQQADRDPQPAHPGRSGRRLRPVSDRIPADERPVVFIGPYEHHSNELPWRESIADVVTIAEDADGRIDLDHPRARAAPTTRIGR